MSARIGAQAALALGGLLAPSLLAVTATGLSSFDGMEQPLVRYFPAQRIFEPDNTPEIIDEGGGVFRMSLRYNTLWWDGDRDTPNRDRQRAEVKGLGPHQKNGDTFDYATTWRVDPAFRGTRRFCHLFQLKATNGDDGAPLITMSIEPEAHHAAVQYWSGHSRNSAAVREFAYNPGAWETVRIRVKIARTNDGEVLVAVNGDGFKGVSGVAVYRPDATDYRPKWGIYRGVSAGQDLGDDYVEHKNISANKVDSPSIDNLALETTAREKARASVPAALAWLETQPPSPARAQALGAIAGLWAESDATAAIRWAETLDDTAVRTDSISRIFSRWALLDQDAAMKWLVAHAPNPDLDPLLWLQATDTTLRYVLRPQALVCAGLITDPDWRYRAYVAILLIWTRQPSARADALLYVREKANLSPAQKEALEQKIAALRPNGGAHGES